MPQLNSQITIQPPRKYSHNAATSRLRDPWFLGENFPMRTLAIGDIHGCLTALETLLGFVQPQADDLIITLGDYVDRGPDSRGVLDLLIALLWQGQLIPLRGNHDQMFCGAGDGKISLPNWLALGGVQTLQSYGGNFDGVPVEHWEFLKIGLINHHETATEIFVHGGVWPDYPVADQDERVLLWARFYDQAPHFSGKRIICGHTNQKSGLPNNIGHALCIDTRAHGGGWLTCLHVESGQIFQANQRGETRLLHLDEL